MLELYLAVALLFGGMFGYGVSEKRKQKETQETVQEKIEPEYWGNEAHRKFMRECATQCRKSGALFKGYEPLSGDCQCQ